MFSPGIVVKSIHDWRLAFSPRAGAGYACRQACLAPAARAT
jgi:hypothetical protein